MRSSLIALHALGLTLLLSCAAGTSTAAELRDSRDTSSLRPSLPAQVIERAEAHVIDAQGPDLEALQSDPAAKPWLFLPNLTVHADLRYRMKAIQALDQGDPVRAVHRFRQAAHYADKASQAALAEMYWEGRGIEQDRALAYAWMDLAAERGYRFFLAKREAYWAALDPRERSRSLEVGGSLYAEFGDEVARPRLQARLDNANNLLGLYKGKASFRSTHMNTRHGKVLGIRSDQYFADVFDDQGYWAWADATWEAVGQGQVEVLPLRDGAPRDRTAVSED